MDAGLGSAGTKLVLRVDYSVDVKVKTVDLGFMSIGMNPEVPMRLRYRNVRLLVDFAQSCLERFHLSFGEADVDVEDPGGWQVVSPGSMADLFDVLGSRSGRRAARPSSRLRDQHIYLITKTLKPPWSSGSRPGRSMPARQSAGGLHRSGSSTRSPWPPSPPACVRRRSDLSSSTDGSRSCSCKARGRRTASGGHSTCRRGTG
ncbi:hypothetical protein AB0M29_38000 [Streptomyces sp. NPDC051976]|uniref:hypothetical protein n=1 Tax=Streptomyces sp. NPDC051976 TaxID=3154947 RepID=UPI0034194AB6